MTALSTIGIFAASQPRYAAVGIPTFPVHIDPDGKKPMVSNYAKFGLRGSAELVRKFGTATGIGFMAGERSRISVVDIDTGMKRYWPMLSTVTAKHRSSRAPVRANSTPTIGITASAA